MADARTWQSEPPHDRPIAISTPLRYDGDLVGLPDWALMTMLIMELRGLRADIAELSEHVRRSRSG